MPEEPEGGSVSAHRRRAGKKNLGYKARGGMYSDQLGLPAEKTQATSKRKQKGITNDQAKLLAKLQRQLKAPYTGSGMTSLEATQAIDDCFARLPGRTSAR